MSFCTTLSQVFTRLEQVFPHLETTQKQLVDNLIRPPCAGNNQAIVDRSDELLSSLELLVRVHPTHRLNRTETLACLSGLGEITASLTLVIEKFDEKMESAQTTYETLLHDHFMKVRKTRLDLISAQQLYNKQPASSVHLFSSASNLPKRNGREKGKGRSFPQPRQVVGASAPSKNTKSLAPPLPGRQNWLAGPKCYNCEGEHTLMECPDLEPFKKGLKSLPLDKCRLCLKDRSKSATHPEKCFEYKRGNRTISTVCEKPGHARVHRAICKQCYTANLAPPPARTSSLNVKLVNPRA